MNNKARSLLNRINQDKGKGNFTKALKKVNDGLSKFPNQIDFYVEGADVSLESGEPLQAVQFLKRAFGKFPAERDQLDLFLREKLRELGDPILGKLLLEQSVRDRRFDTAMEGLEDLPSPAARDLLRRTRTKRQSLVSPGNDDFSSNGKIITNKLCEALLCLRLGRLKDAMRSILQILEEKPVEAEKLEPFINTLTKKHAEEGRIRFTHARALTLVQRYDKSMLQLVTAARLDPDLAGECLDFIRTVSEGTPRLPETVDSALVELLLIAGDVDRAVGLLRERLDNDPGSATAVMELITYNVESIKGSLALHFLYVEAALTSKQPGHALEMIRNVGKNEETRSEMYEWLVQKSMSSFLPAPILVYSGELAILEGKFDRAIEVFTAVCGNSPNEVSDVLAVVERHMKTDTSLRDFYEEKMGSRIKMQSATAGDSFEVQHFEDSEFTFSSEESPLDLEAEADRPSLHGEDAGAEPGLDRFDGISSIPSGKQLDVPHVAPLDLSGDDCTREEREESATSAPVDVEILWDEEDEATAAAAADSPIDPGPELPATGEVEEEEQSDAPIDEDAPEITEENVNNVAKGLYESGARSFFHVDASEQDDGTAQPEPIEAQAETSEDSRRDTPEEAPPHADDPAKVVREQTELVERYDDDRDDETEGEEPLEDQSFSGRLAMFRAGSLETDAIVALIEEAFDSGHIEELGELLEFEPRNAEEQFMRKRYQVECHIVENYPAAALEILDTIDPARLSADEARFVAIKTAVCHQAMNNYELAHEILLKMSEQYPDDEHIKQLARRNYEQFLKSQIDDSPTLEKATYVAIDS